MDRRAVKTKAKIDQTNFQQAKRKERGGGRRRKVWLFVDEGDGHVVWYMYTKFSLYSHGLVYLCRK